jgi:DNA-binding winged helix-turn-helix (wHTH) protein
MSFVGGHDILFGSFRLSLRERTLSDGRGRLRLRSRAFDLLVALIERRDRVASKAELMERVWGELFVGENNLHVQIAAIRRVLGGGRRWIVTIPGKGYRFIGDIALAEASSAPEAGLRLAAATARFWLDAGLAGEARTWLADALDHEPGPAQVDVLARMQRSLTELSREASAGG